MSNFYAKYLYRQDFFDLEKRAGKEVLKTKQLIIWKYSKLTT